MKKMGEIFGHVVIKEVGGDKTYLVSQETWDLIKDQPSLDSDFFAAKKSGRIVRARIGEVVFPILAEVNRWMNYKQIICVRDVSPEHEEAFKRLSRLGQVRNDASGVTLIDFPEGLFQPESQEPFIDLSGKIYAGHGQCVSRLSLQDTLKLLIKAAESPKFVNFRDWTTIGGGSTWTGAGGSSRGGYISLRDGDILIAVRTDYQGHVSPGSLQKRLLETAEGLKRLGLKPMDIEKTVWSSRVKQPDYWVAI